MSVDGNDSFAALTAPGARFAIEERAGLREFASAPPDLALMLEGARRYGNATFIVEESDDGEERRLSYEQIFAWRDRLLPLLGIARGDRVAICMRNRAEWIVAFLAVIRAGGVAVLLNSRGAPAELVAMIDEVTPALVLADSRRAALIRAGGYVGRMLDLTRPLDEAELAARAAQTPAPQAGTATPEDPCVILFTSGTTGRVKGAVLSHRNLITGLMAVQLSGLQVLHDFARAKQTSVESLLADSGQQASLLVYPLFHISGLGAAFLSPMLVGAKIVIMRRWGGEAAARLIARERITMFAGVPTMLFDLIGHAGAAGADLSSLRNLGSGGQALPVNLLDALRAAVPHAMIGTGYGMTECSGSIAQAVGEAFMRKPGSAGRVLPMVDIRIEGPEGEALQPGETGEIVVRGAQVMRGYWNRAEETAAVLSPDGWLRTGDVGHVDDEGYIFIVDRKKDMVISGGENIYCAEVERVMGQMPEIAECAAFGIPDERLGELLVAVVRPRAESSIAEAEVIDWVAERLARYKAPGRVAIAAAPLPRNHLDKLDKQALRAAWAATYGAL